MRPRKVLVLSMLTACLAQGQDASRVAEKVRELHKASNDTTRANLLAGICFDLSKSNPDSAQLVGEQALSLAKRLGNRRVLGVAHNQLGRLAAMRGDLARADSLMAIALDIGQNMSQPTVAMDALRNMGWIARLKGDHEGAMSRFKQALGLSEEARDTSMTAELLCAIGQIQERTGELDKAKENLDRALEMERMLNRPARLAECLMALANTESAIGSQQEAVVAMQEAIALYAHIGDHLDWGRAEGSMGRILSSKDPKTALIHFQNALAHFDSINSSVDQAQVLLRLGHVQMVLGRAADAEASLNNGLALTKEAGDARLAMDLELGLAELAADRGDAGAAMLHFGRHTAIRDSLQLAEQRQEIAKLKSFADTTGEDKEAALRRANEETLLALDEASDLRTYGGAMILGLALFAAGLLWYIQRQRRKHQARVLDLAAKVKDNKALIAELNTLLRKGDPANSASRRIDRPERLAEGHK